MSINAFACETKTSCLDAALDYASCGFKVLPTHGLINGTCTCGGRANCKKGKHPSTLHGVKDATSNTAIIREWWEPSYWLNVGIATGGHVFVLDIDPRHSGDRTLEELIAEHGELPETPSVKTGGGGIHYYFRYPDGVTIPSRSGVADGIDVRGDSGYVLAPPSNHESGSHYEWIVGLDTPLADAPSWLLALVIKTPPPSKSSGFTLVMGSSDPCDFAEHPGAKEGERNDTLMRLLGVHISRGDNPKTVRALALKWADKCWPPIPPQDIEKRLRWAEGKRVDSGGGFGDEDREAFVSNFGFDAEPCELTNKLQREGDELVSSFADAEVKSQDFHSPTPNTIPAKSKGITRHDTLAPEPSADGFPKLHADAYHGLAGAIVRAIAPETEADPAGVLVTLLTAFGNAIGKRSHYSMNAGTHHANLFVSLVGDTASAKGQAFTVVKRLFEAAEPAWESEAIAYGLSSGEGLVDRVKDEQEQGKDGVFRMPSSKRLFCVETEFVKPITAMRREGNTLSAMLRAVWDSQTLEVNTRGKTKLRASNAHIGIIAHITPDELSKLLTGSVEVVNGFANRFLWAFVKRSKALPEGGDPSVGDAFVEPLRKAVEKAKTIGRVERDEDAKALWAEVYTELSEAKPGAFGSATARGHAQTLRLSLIYALLDGSQVIRVEHLRAALAVWKYCEASARLIFNGSVVKAEVVTDPTADEPEPLEMRLLNAIIQLPGITRKGLHEATGNRVKASEMNEALASIERRGLAHRGRCQPEHGGRPAECWWPGTLDDGDDDIIPNDDIPNDNECVDSVRGLSVEGVRPPNLANELINSGDENAESELVSSQSLFAGNNANALECYQQEVKQVLANHFIHKKANPVPEYDDPDCQVLANMLRKRTEELAIEKANSQANAEVPSRLNHTPPTLSPQSHDDNQAWSEEEFHARLRATARGNTVAFASALDEEEFFALLRS